MWIWLSCEITLVYTQMWADNIFSFVDIYWNFFFGTMWKVIYQLNERGS